MLPVISSDVPTKHSIDVVSGIVFARIRGIEFPLILLKLENGSGRFFMCYAQPAGYWYSTSLRPGGALPVLLQG